MSWQLLFTKQARKDAKKLAAAGLKPKAQELLAVLEADPFQSPPPFEKLVGDLSGAYSRRINIQHRLVYQVLVTSESSRCSGCGPITSEANKRIKLARRSVAASQEAGALAAYPRCVRCTKGSVCGIIGGTEGGIP